MTNEESLYNNLLDTCQLLELHNLLEFASANAYSWYMEQKTLQEQDFSPAESFILEQAGKIKK